MFAYGSWNAWTLGRPDVARQREEQMMAVINADDAYDVAWSHYYAAHLRVYMGEYAQGEVLAACALERSEKHQFPYVAAASRCVLGRALAQLGRATDGIAMIRDGMANLLENGAGLLISNFTTYLGAALALEGSLTAALETIEQALEVNPDVTVLRPETFRIRGELRLKRTLLEEAEADFHESIALAQTMGAKAWELRTTMSLAQLYAKQGRRDEARAMLSEIYHWFTEGFDTADLKDAKTLLDELSG
jgi:tetratricopeptide (TPR) repeat protein